ncbi:hypothetical protein [Streptomyces sp. NPDC048521]|uniref:hypothetical protein n=1 Tax=Streptomyces sp. NPDC048521 TaxID=3365566 RepID=UPI00371482DA
MTEEEATCTGKTPFHTRKAAKQRANQIRRHTGNRMRAYQCPFCAAYHLGHRPGHATHLRSGHHRTKEPTT